MSIANDAFQGGERSPLRFSDVYFLDLPNAFDLPLNVWPPQCVVHDMDPPQLLRSHFYLPMDSLVGMSIEEVNIYTWHDLIHAATISTTDCLYKMLSLTIMCTRPQSLVSLGLLVSENTFLMHNYISLPMNHAWMNHVWSTYQHSQDTRQEARSTNNRTMDNMSI